jgi:hypothetical protein
MQQFPFRTWLFVALSFFVARPLDGQSHSSARSRRDTIHVLAIPGEAPKKPVKTDDVFIVATQRGDGAWFAAQYAEYSRAVRLVGVDSPSVCESREVEFTYMSNASPTGSPPVLKARGEWVVPTDTPSFGRYQTLLQEERLDSLIAQRETGSCVAVAHWRLGDNPGRHYLRARLTRENGVTVASAAAAKTTELFTTIAHAPPAIVAGVVYPFREDSPEDTTSTGASTGEEDEELGRTLGTIVGFDFPIVLGFLSPKAQEVLQHFRPMIATNFSDPGEDVYVGLEVLPLLPHGGARSAANPLQLTVGYKIDNGDRDTPFVGLHFSTTGLLSDFLKAVGVAR